MIGLARLDGGLALIALFDVLSRVVEIAVLEHVTARREAIAIAMTQVIGLVVLASLVFVVVVIGVELDASGAWSGPRTATVVGRSG